MKTVEVRKTKKTKDAAIRTPKRKPGLHRQNLKLYLTMGALVFVVFLVYANSLNNDFVFDDKVIILENKLLRSLSNIPHLLVASYRPFRDITHALDFAVWGENPFGFHLTNILIHAANTVLVLLLVRRFTGELLTAGLAAIIFALHPIQTDAVTYISGRRDILFTLFYLASFYVYLNYRKSRSLISFVLFILLWGFSLMSKEMAVTLPLFIFLWNFCNGWSETIGSWWKRLLKTTGGALNRDKWFYLPMVLALPAYIWYQTVFKGGSILAREGFKYWGGSFYTNTLLSLRVQAWYLKQLIWPTPIVQYKDAFDVSTTIWDWRVLLSILLLSAVLVAGFWALGRHKLIAFAIFSYFVLLLPVSQIIPHHELLADHYLYLPMLSFALLAALIVQKIAATDEMVKRVAYGTAVLLLIALALTTISRNRVWKDDLTLWQANYSEVPNSIRSVSSLAKAYTNVNPGKAEELYKQCILIDPGYSPAYYSLAVLSEKMTANTTKREASEYYREIEQLIQYGLSLPDAKIASRNTHDPRLFRAQLTTALALIRRNENEVDKALNLLWEAIKIDPYYPSPYTMLATYYRDNNPDKAVEVLQYMVAAFPTSYQPLEQISSLLIRYKRYDEAIQNLEKMLAMIPGDCNANQQLSRVYAAKGECGKARTYLSAARAAASGASQQKDVQDAQSEIEQACAGK
jgi:tetratricopeptide (TPR) repeat protein